MSQDDQSVLIANHFFPNKLDYSFVDTPAMQDYIKAIIKNLKDDPRGDIVDLLHHKVSPNLLSLMDELVRLNPNDRKSSEEVLSNPIFDGIRDPSLENASFPKHINLKIDNLPMNANGEVSDFNTKKMKEFIIKTVTRLDQD